MQQKNVTENEVLHARVPTQVEINALAYCACLLKTKKKFYKIGTRSKAPDDEEMELFLSSSSSDSSSFFETGKAAPSGGKIRERFSSSSLPTGAK
jgi:hypothetical protein